MIAFIFWELIFGGIGYWIHGDTGFLYGLAVIPVATIGFWLVVGVVWFLFKGWKNVLPFVLEAAYNFVVAVAVMCKVIVITIGRWIHVVFRPRKRDEY